MASTLDIAGVSSIGDVEFIERIGVGIGSGRFRARLGGGGPVVSLLLAEAEKFDKQGLMDWARRMKRVDHPGVPGVVQIEDTLEPGFVAQRYVDGETLEERVERLGGPLAAVDGLPLLLQAAAALRAAHRNSLAHGALAPRSLVLEVRDGAMDAVRLVGWRPLAPGLTHERAVARDLRALGELLYLALAGVPAPGRDAGDPPEPGAAVPVEFGDLADAWGRSGRSGAGRSIFGALAAARRMTTVDAFVDALLPEFSRLTGDALAEVAYELSADREFKAEVERQRDRQRELDSKLRFIRDWLRDNAPAIEVVDDRVAGLEAQERSLRNLQVELSMLLDRPIRPGETLASTAARVEVRAPEPAVAPPPVDDEADDAPQPAAIEPPPPPAAPASGMGKLLAVALGAAAVAGLGVWLAVRPATPPAVAPPSAAPDSVALASAAPVTAAPVTAAPATAAPVSAAPVTAAPATEPPPPPPPPPPPGMVLVPAGEVVAGLSPESRAKALAQCAVDTADNPKARETYCTEEALAGEMTTEKKAVKAFYLDRLEVSQLQYDRCVNQRGCKTLKLTWELDEQPATGVTWEMARQYCENQGGRLPTAAEWLRAARGDDNRLYPWGDESPEEGKLHRANYGRIDRRGPGPSRADGHKYAAPVGVFAERSASPFGLANMAGNVREWASDETPDGSALTVGGGWRDLGMDLRVTRVLPVAKDQYQNDLGFRCAMDVPSR